MSANSLWSRGFFRRLPKATRQRLKCASALLRSARTPAAKTGHRTSSGAIVGRNAPGGGAARLLLEGVCGPICSCCGQALVEVTQIADAACRPELLPRRQGLQGYGACLLNLSAGQ